MPLAIAALVVLSVVNYLGVKPGSRVLNVLVVLKVAALAILIGAGLLRRRRTPAGGARRAAVVAAGRPSTLVAFGAAHGADPLHLRRLAERQLRRRGDRQPEAEPAARLIAGTVAVVVIYVTVNVVYLRALGLNGLAATADAGRRRGAAGCSAPSGDLFVSGAIAISTFGFLDLAILAPTRVYYAMAADRLFVPALATLHPRFGTPSLAIIVQSTWSCVLALTGTYDQLLNYVVFADWIFFGLTVLTVLTLPPQAAARAARPPTPSARPAIRSCQILFVHRRRRRRRQRRRRAARPRRARADRAGGAVYSGMRARG